ncbi:MAG TPA: transcriptional repressor LexA [Armatimonadota bacterium]|jgi:repressor LexA
MTEAQLTGRRREIYDYVVKAIKDRGYPPTMREIAAALGFKSPSTVLHHLRILEEQGFIEREAERNRAMRPTASQDSAAGAGRLVPLVGRVAAGAPILAAENLDGYLVLPPELFSGPQLFMLQVQGDSMIEAGILDGDYVIVNQQETANDGDIVVALLEDEATVKRLWRRADYIELQPENPTMEPIRATNVQVLGKVVGVVRAIS